MSGSSRSAMALREAFGDRKLPEITRKITACVACRKLKVPLSPLVPFVPSTISTNPISQIKCHMKENKPPCTRCLSRNLSCSVNKSLQMLLEDDATWKDDVERRLELLESSIAQRPTDASPNTLSANTRGLRQILRTGRANSNAITLPQSPETPGSFKLNLSCSLGAFPASSMISLTVTDEGSRMTSRPDLISCGLISPRAAEDLFSFYQQHLDPCIHNMLEEDDSLASVRARSSLLAAAICSVAAFCKGSQDYQSCLDAFTREVSRKVFAETHTFDDVRALCVGAFWLNEISSALNGLGECPSSGSNREARLTTTLYPAVRIATELDLHRCITKMPHTKKACYDRTRLYFLVYLCDHHCSLSRGRPPMTREMRTLKSPGVFLQSELSTRSDLRLISQVELWSVTRRVFDIFGADIESLIVRSRSVELEKLSREYDTWYQDWFESLSLQRDFDNFSRLLFDLYHHSAKLYLFSHAFRGPVHADTNHLSPGPDNTAHFTHRALQSALAVIRCVVEETKTSIWLQKLPFYLGTMIAFASVCAIRTATQGNSIGDATPSQILDSLRQLVELLNASSTTASQPHPITSIARGLAAVMSPNGLRRPSHEPMDEDTSGLSNNLGIDFGAFANDALNFSLGGDREDWAHFADAIFADPESGPSWPAE